MNVLQEPIAACACAPETGCRTEHRSRWGAPTVCVVVTRDFLDYYRARGIDLEQPAPEVRGPGLKVGDTWCMGAARWSEAAGAGVAPPVVVAATPLEVLECIPIDDLLARAADL